MRAGGRSQPSRRSITIAIALVVIVAVATTVVLMRRGPAVPPLGVSSRLQSLTSVSPTAAEWAAHPSLALVSAMAPWRALEPSDDVFDWTQLEANVADARDNGYRLIVRIMAGRAAPPWLTERGVATIQLFGSDPNAADHCEPIQAPVPWDPVVEAEYRELLEAFGAWLAASDGAAGVRADHVAIVPVAMPTILGSEMTLSYGPPGPCPDGTSAAGQDLRALNRAAWDAVATEAERRARLEAAWRSAIAIHLATLPPQTASAIAYGHLFDDRQEAALRIATELVPGDPERLWSMYTNLQAKVRPDGSVGPWSEVCPRCHEVVLAAVDAGGGVGFQLAGTSTNDSLEEVQTAVNAALETYPLGFLEAQPGAIDTYAPYLLDGPESVQTRILHG